MHNMKYYLKLDVSSDKKSNSRYYISSKIEI